MAAMLFAFVVRGTGGGECPTIACRPSGRGGLNADRHEQRPQRKREPAAAGVVMGLPRPHAANNCPSAEPDYRPLKPLARKCGDYVARCDTAEIPGEKKHERRTVHRESNARKSHSQTGGCYK